ncbi:MAG: hypothetical protein TRG1_3234 [Flavobacteriaceae bacterium FS1-H7996/R]|nr:MAG: hypothetical protein TRG1_3234 [Flavobacteriaceae bacterium FS1-H7996/R]
MTFLIEVKNREVYFCDLAAFLLSKIMYFLIFSRKKNSNKKLFF